MDTRTLSVLMRPKLESICKYSELSKETDVVIGKEAEDARLAFAFFREYFMLPQQIEFNGEEFGKLAKMALPMPAEVFINWCNSWHGEHQVTEEAMTDCMHHIEKALGVGPISYSHFEALPIKFGISTEITGRMARAYRPVYFSMGKDRFCAMFSYWSDARRLNMDDVKKPVISLYKSIGDKYETCAAIDIAMMAVKHNMASFKVSPGVNMLANQVKLLAAREPESFAYHINEEKPIKTYTITFRGKPIHAYSECDPAGKLPEKVLTSLMANGNHQLVGYDGLVEIISITRQ